MPAIAVTADNADRAAAVPVRAARQLRVSPMASTMVKASTNSTPDARNVVVATPNVGVIDFSKNGQLQANLVRTAAPGPATHP
jgi:hypothetical protein